MLRGNKRFSIIHNSSSHLELKDIYVDVDVDGNEKFKGILIDISQNGIGFRIDNISENSAEMLKRSGKLYVTIHYMESMILTGVKLIWGLFKTVGGITVLTGGFDIHTISTDDNIRLSELIEEIRKSTAP